MTTKMTVNAGVCGMTSIITANLSDDMMSVNIVIDSPCPMIRKMSPIEGSNPYEMVATPFTENEIYIKAAECIRHAACPVPSAIIKCAEAEAGLGLKKPVSMEFTE